MTSTLQDTEPRMPNQIARAAPSSIVSSTLLQKKSSKTNLGEQADSLTIYPQTHRLQAGVDTNDTLVLTRTLPLLELFDEIM